jgi:hypothetical protein
MKLTVDERRRVYNAARRSRRWAEKNIEAYDACGDLCGLCGVASVYLHRQLRREGIRAEIVAGDGHAYVMFKNHIIDVTATQFNKPRIVVRCRRGKQPYYWEVNHIEKSGRAFMKYQKKAGWPTEQIFGGAK